MQGPGENPTTSTSQLSGTRPAEKRTHHRTSYHHACMKRVPDKDTRQAKMARQKARSRDEEGGFDASARFSVGPHRAEDGLHSACSQSSRIQCASFISNWLVLGPEIRARLVRLFPGLLMQSFGLSSYFLFHLSQLSRDTKHCDRKNVQCHECQMAAVIPEPEWRRVLQSNEEPGL